MATEAQNLSREMAQAYLTGTAPPEQTPYPTQLANNYGLGSQ